MQAFFCLGFGAPSRVDALGSAVLRSHSNSSSRLSLHFARLLEDAELVVVAAPAYLQRAGTPQTLEDLPSHECIQFELPSNGRRIPWLFQVQGQEQAFAGEAGYSVSHDVLGGVTLAKHGAGLFQTYKFIVEHELADGALLEVLKPFGGRTRPFTLLYPHGRYVPHRVRASVDFLLAYRDVWAAP